MQWTEEFSGNIEQLEHIEPRQVASQKQPQRPQHAHSIVQPKQSYECRGWGGRALLHYREDKEVRPAVGWWTKLPALRHPSSEPSAIEAQGISQTSFATPDARLDSEAPSHSAYEGFSGQQWLWWGWQPDGDPEALQAAEACFTETVEAHTDDCGRWDCEWAGLACGWRGTRRPYIQTDGV